MSKFPYTFPFKFIEFSRYLKICSQMFMTGLILTSTMNKSLRLLGSLDEALTIKSMMGNDLSVSSNLTSDLTIKSNIVEK